MVIFNNWFQNCFVSVPDVKQKIAQLGQEPKDLVILHSCSTHSNEGAYSSMMAIIAQSQYKVLSPLANFLPPNVTLLIQPMDQDVLECLKRIYRKSILKEMISQTKNDMLAFLKKLII